MQLGASTPLGGRTPRPVRTWLLAVSHVAVDVANVALDVAGVILDVAGVILDVASNFCGRFNDREGFIP